jgi:hypothetical protein
VSQVCKEVSHGDVHERKDGRESGRAMSSKERSSGADGRG